MIIVFTALTQSLENKMLFSGQLSPLLSHCYLTHMCPFLISTLVPETLAFKGRQWVAFLHVSFLIQVGGGEVTELAGMRSNVMEYLWVGNKNLLVPCAPSSHDGLADIKSFNKGLPWWCSGWESACQCRGHGFQPWAGRIPHAVLQLSPWATTTETCVPRARAPQEKPLQWEARTAQRRVAPARHS